MELKKAARLSLSEQVSLQLEELIETGAWPIGERIPPEPELVSQLGVSRNTVREAVRSLVHAGLLVTRQGDGTYVRAASGLDAVLQKRLKRSNLLEVLEVRYALEQEAGRLAAIRRTDADIAAIKACMERCEIAAAEQHVENYVQADMELHLAVIQASHNSVLFDLYSNMMETVRSSITGVIQQFQWGSEYAQTHRALVDKIIEQDVDGATEAVKAYIKTSADALGSNEKEGQ